MPTRPIEDVLRDHTPELMRLPGVVGTFEGATKNGERCIKVMVKEKTKELERAIPKELEGWRVEIEVTGEIRPLGGAPG